MDGIKIGEILEVKVPDYLPPPAHRGTMDELGLPPFNTRQITLMLRDSQVKLGCAIKSAPLMHVKYQITGQPEVAQFAHEQMAIAWDTIVPKMVNALWYRMFFGQPTYRKAPSGRIELTGCNDYYIGDCQFLEIQQKLVGFRVKSRNSSNQATIAVGGEQDLYGMKALIYIHKQIHGDRAGMSELEGAYSAWLEKTGQDGALAKRRLWFYKNSFDSGIILHPPGNYQWTVNGQLQNIPYRDIARQAVERAHAGSVMAFPQEYDQEGNKLWEYIPAKMNGDGQPMIGYVEQLNTEMLRGMGIPDDIISQTSGTGSYAGRSIPFQAFLTSQTGTIRDMFNAIWKQVILPLCWWNFESIDVEATGIECDRDKLLPPDGPEQPPGGMPLPGGPGGDPSQIDPNAVDPQQAAAAAAQMQAASGQVPQ